MLQWTLLAEKVIFGRFGSFWEIVKNGHFEAFWHKKCPYVAENAQDRLKIDSTLLLLLLQLLLTTAAATFK